jgi:acetyl-CoA acetyltransferase
MVKKYNLRKLAKVLAFAESGGDQPKNFILKPTSAIQNCLDIYDLTWSGVGHYEVNEAFAVGNVLLMKIRTIERERMNRRGGAIAHGHAIGSTGASLLIKEVDILETDKQRYGIVSACNAVDEATAILIENPYA